MMNASESVSEVTAASATTMTKPQAIFVRFMPILNDALPKVGEVFAPQGGLPQLRYQTGKENPWISYSVNGKHIQGRPTDTQYLEPEGGMYFVFEDNDKINVFVITDRSGRVVTTRKYDPKG